MIRSGSEEERWEGVPEEGERGAEAAEELVLEHLLGRHRVGGPVPHLLVLGALHVPHADVAVAVVLGGRAVVDRDAVLGVLEAAVAHLDPATAAGLDTGADAIGGAVLGPLVDHRGSDQVSAVLGEPVDLGLTAAAQVGDAGHVRHDHVRQGAAVAARALRAVGAEPDLRLRPVPQRRDALDGERSELLRRHRMIIHLSGHGAASDEEGEKGVGEWGTGRAHMRLLRVCFCPGLQKLLRKVLLPEKRHL